MHTILFGIEIGRKILNNNRINKSPLFTIIKEYLDVANQKNKQINIFVPYIKTKILKELLDNVTSKIIIVTTWKTDDLLSGSSELELYPFCKERGIALYVNNSIHLKVYSGGFDDMILATANISQRGLLPNGNYECATLIKNINNEDRLYFAEIRRNAHHVDDEMYEQLLIWYKEQEKKPKEDDKFNEIIDSIAHDNFLISALPMTRNVEILEEAYQRISDGLEASNDREVRDSVFHDLANYKIALKLSKKEFREQLKNSFFSHPFIKKIDEFISPEAYFGRIKEWIQKNCTDVPVPSRRELTGNVQVLLDWFEKLGDGKYAVDIPGEHSQRIRRVKH